jgi:hypothetical protein
VWNSNTEMKIRPNFVNFFFGKSSTIINHAFESGEIFYVEDRRRQAWDDLSFSVVPRNQLNNEVRMEELNNFVVRTKLLRKGFV